MRSSLQGGPLELFHHGGWQRHMKTSRKRRLRSRRPEEARPTSVTVLLTLGASRASCVPFRKACSFPQCILTIVLGLHLQGLKGLLWPHAFSLHFLKGIIRRYVHCHHVFKGQPGHVSNLELLLWQALSLQVLKLPFLLEFAWEEMLATSYMTYKS